jgi:hypothetical protein
MISARGSASGLEVQAIGFAKPAANSMARGRLGV